jgi:hypothetical protein
MARALAPTQMEQIYYQLCEKTTYPKMQWINAAYDHMTFAASATSGAIHIGAESLGMTRHTNNLTGVP